jgi:hypothetical protein
VLGVDDAVGYPADEAPVALTRDELAELLPAVTGSDRLRTRACRMGLLIPVGDDVVVRSPALAQLVADAIDAGASASAALDLAAAVIGAADDAGRAATDVLAAAIDDGNDIEPLLRRGRVLLARAIATHTIDRAGHHLIERSAERPDLAEIVASIRVGTEPRRPGRRRTSTG